MNSQSRFLKQKNNYKAQTIPSVLITINVGCIAKGDISKASFPLLLFENTSLITDTRSGSLGKAR